MVIWVHSIRLDETSHGNGKHGPTTTTDKSSFRQTAKIVNQTQQIIRAALFFC